jgi:hypothetical protein
VLFNYTGHQQFCVVYLISFMAVTKMECKIFHHPFFEVFLTLCFIKIQEKPHKIYLTKVFDMQIKFVVSWFMFVHDTHGFMSINKSASIFRLHMSWYNISMLVKSLSMFIAQLLKMVRKEVCSFNLLTVETAILCVPKFHS